MAHFRSNIQSELEEEFVNFQLAMIKAQSIRNMNEKEIQRYNAEKQVIRICPSSSNNANRSGEKQSGSVEYKFSS